MAERKGRYVNSHIGTKSMPCGGFCNALTGAAIGLAIGGGSVGATWALFALLGIPFWK
jgi:hypothetical protein